ncbi:hypothetical protein E8E13_000155 [Curvularia kusanoi]|uniref:Uncharacterized protein n=1 Tax=Curvularia kusanoi TaxID=90978 RepID=A0A9P4TKM5_CURKU|nr:hypothetical protein E8E13_000155 [Curvularia kusanoi]
MDEPPRKRRKTSSPIRAPTSPLRKPPRRPSFASPTKASLARSYPTLLPTRTPPPKDVRVTEQKAPVPSAGATSTARRSPLAEAQAVQQNKLSRPIEGALGQERKGKGAGVLPLNPDLEKKKQEKARLEREVEELEAQVSRCVSEIASEQKRVADATLLPAQRADLSKFILKLSGENAQEQRPTPVSGLLCSFLPFSALPITPLQEHRAEKPIASHRPIEFKDPLPYLQMFTSLDLSTQLELPKDTPHPSEKRVHQKHTVDISGPQKLLKAQLAINIDCLSNDLVDVDVLHLSSWAERELGTFMRTKAKEKDLGNACWAIDSFLEIAMKRAHYWRRCEKAFASLLPGRAAAGAEDTSTAALKSSTILRKDLSRHLGCDTLILQDEHVLLKISWRITFDWTGEAESAIDVECAIPTVWKEADANDAFSKVPETFDSLLRTKGVFNATKIIAALLFSQ